MILTNETINQTLEALSLGKINQEDFKEILGVSVEEALKIVTNRIKELENETN